MRRHELAHVSLQVLYTDAEPGAPYFNRKLPLPGHGVTPNSSEKTRGGGNVRCLFAVSPVDIWLRRQCHPSRDYVLLAKNVLVITGCCMIPLITILYQSP